jgi:hypothetical protein
MATVRRVRRIIRKIDPWTALKVSALVWAVLAVAIVLGTVIFWSVLDRAGLPDRITEFMVEITLIEEGTQPFANVEQFFRASVFGAVVWWVVMTGATVAGAVVYNLVSDIVGGLEIVVLEETYNPTMANPTAAPVLHPPADYRNGASSEVADLPTQEHQPVSPAPETTRT